MSRNSHLWYKYIRRKILKQTQEDIEEIDKQIELEAAAEPEMEDDMQSFVPKNGKFIKENVKSKKKSNFTKEDIKLKEDMNDILKSVLSESQN